MKKETILAVAAALPLALCALDLSDKADIRFAESYAFSTNRAALIATLPPESKAWFTYSILDAQTEGRLDDADALLKKWVSSRVWDDASLTAMRDRQDFLCYDRESAEGKDAIWRLKRALGDAGIKPGIPVRESEIQPNTYPSELDQSKISFAQLWRHSAYMDSVTRLSKKFRFIAFLEDSACTNAAINELVARNDFLPDTPGMFDHLLAYLKAGDGEDAERHRSVAAGRFANLTLAQLDALAKALKDNPRWSLTGGPTYKNGQFVHNSSSRAFIDAVFAKLVPGADADATDFTVRETILKQRLAFAESLGESVRKERILAEQKSLLALYSEYGLELEHIDLFWSYLNTYGSGHAMSGDDLIGKYLCACRQAARPRQGQHPSDFNGYVDCRFANAAIAEFDLVSGKPPAEVDVGALSPEKYKEIQERVELNWARSNPRRFASADAVSLAIDVKNVPKMRIAVFELDAAAACREAKGEVAADIDLDCAVPTHVRTIDYATPSVLRHRETLEFPELKEPGLYVVECSGQGVASRALVRKGRLRATERRDAAGHVFAVLDEEGRIVKGAKLWLGETVFKAEENGEIPVPFATTDREAHKKTALIEAGRLATTIAFNHVTESYSLALGVVLPPESLVAGCEATALIRPVLRTSGIQSTLKILENPVLAVTFRDVRGRETVKKFPGFELLDDAESVCRFKVPANLACVDFQLEGTLKRASGGDDERVSATWSCPVNVIAGTTIVEQLFLRRTSVGYYLECRGRTGEPLPHRAMTIGFHHRVVHEDESRLWCWLTLQGDENGVIALGPLVDIDRIKLGRFSIGERTTGNFEGYEWKLDCGVKWPYGTKTIASAEGEVIELPVRGLFDGAWPGADKMENRVSLLAVNKNGKYTVDCIDACSYSNGVLRIAGLYAGDYRLTFRTEDIPTVKISVVRTGKGVGDGGVIAGAARAVTDTGAPNTLRIESAGVSKEGVLRVRVANAGADARVHVFAVRTMRDVREGPSPFTALSRRLDNPAIRIWKWCDARSAYVSGRDLGDKLRYILDRRQEPGRTGNMLQLPSLILNPWTTTETSTDEVRQKDGKNWDADAAPEAAGAEMSDSNGRAYGDSILKSAFVCRDFLPNPMAVFANLKPDEGGIVEIDLSKAAGMQDISVVVTDGHAIDEVALAGPYVPFTPRDLRVKKGFDALADSGYTKSYATVGELYQLLLSLDTDGRDAFADFAFLAEWGRKSDEEKRELYGKHASHELDLFIHEKDRAFFDAVVAPNLRNKRLKDFMDKWLLGEDVSEYSAPGRLQDLNALEQCLLARRVEELGRVNPVARVVARNFADWCEANPVNPDEDDRRISIALAEMEHEMESKQENKPLGAALLSNETWNDQGWTTRQARPGTVTRRSMKRRAARDGMVADVQSAWSSQLAVMPAAVPQAQGMVMSARSPGGADNAMRRRAEMERRQNRQFWRPPERTKEWVESHWYRRRHVADTLSLATPNRFWRDYAAAVAAGKDGAFSTTFVIDAAGTLTDKIAALALTDLGFEAVNGKEIVFSRGGVKDSGRDVVRVERHFFNVMEKNEDGSQKEAAEEFVRGEVYSIETIAMNPTAKRRRVRIVSQLPEGAFPLARGFASENQSVVLEPYGMSRISDQKFYFPLVEGGIGKAAPVVAVERGERTGASGEFSCNVVAESSKRDTTSWRYVSQKATKGEVLEYLKTKNLANVDLSKMGWRFIDGEFAKKALAVLDARGVYCQSLWLAGLEWKECFDAGRMREVLSRRENRSRLAPRLGPVFRSSLVEIAPEADDVFEHREYWPVINARAHAKGGAATIANKTLSNTYRAFLDTLAAKPKLASGDRLLAAVYLLAQDRISEAEEQVAAVDAADVETKMQLDYMKAYLAFSRGDAAGGRAFAEKWVEAAATPLWRGRFRDVVTQADEIAAGDEATPAPGDQAASAPTLALKAESKDGAMEGVIVTARNLASCTLKAYPVDVEIGFSKNPFATDLAASGGVLGMKPAWTEEVQLKDGREAHVSLPKVLRRTNLVLMASGADGRAEDRLALTPGGLDVQVSRETRQLRVRDRKGKPVAGAYVKVYVRDASGRETKFHKDGYTDMRGAFDYASISTDSEFKPAEFAILVLPETLGASIQRIPAAQ